MPRIVKPLRLNEPPVANTGPILKRVAVEPEPTAATPKPPSIDDLLTAELAKIEAPPTQGFVQGGVDAVQEVIGQPIVQQQSPTPVPKFTNSRREKFNRPPGDEANWTEQQQDYFMDNVPAAPDIIARPASVAARLGNIINNTTSPSLVDRGTQVAQSVIANEATPASARPPQYEGMSDDYMRRSLESIAWRDRTAAKLKAGIPLDPNDPSPDTVRPPRQPSPPQTPAVQAGTQVAQEIINQAVDTPPPESGIEAYLKATSRPLRTTPGNPPYNSEYVQGTPGWHEQRFGPTDRTGYESFPEPPTPSSGGGNYGGSDSISSGGGGGGKKPPRDSNDFDPDRPDKPAAPVLFADQRTKPGLFNHAIAGFALQTGDGAYADSAIGDAFARRKFPETADSNLLEKAAYHGGRVFGDYQGYGTRKNFWNMNPEDATGTGIRQVALNTGATGAQAQLARFAAATTLGLASGNYNPLNLAEGGRTSGFSAVNPDEEDPRKSTNPVAELLFDRAMLGRTGRLLPWEEFHAERPDVPYAKYAAYQEYIRAPAFLGLVKGTMDGIDGPELRVVGSRVQPEALVAALAAGAGVIGASSMYNKGRKP